MVDISCRIVHPVSIAFSNCASDAGDLSQTNDVFPVASRQDCYLLCLTLRCQALVAHFVPEIGGQDPRPAHLVVDCFGSRYRSLDCLHWIDGMEVYA